jgi:integrase
MWYNKWYNSSEMYHMPKLTVLEIESISKSGRFVADHRLYLNVDKIGNKSWLFRWQSRGERKTHGLGRYDKRTNSLATARKAALECSSLVAQGICPIEERKRLAGVRSNAAREAVQAALKSEMTFERCAREWHEGKKDEWSNEKHSNQNINTLVHYSFPYFGHTPVAEVSLSDIRKCLDPIWPIKTETASRVRARIENILSYAMISGYRDRSNGNPASWKGQLDQIYPKPEKLKKVRRQKEGGSVHHMALPHNELPEFYSKLVKRAGVSVEALRFCILTVTRTHSIRHARWEQLDLDRKVWTVPAADMKSGVEFKVALSDAAIELLSRLVPLDEYIFPGGKSGKPLSNAGMSSVLKRMGVNNATVHGFRSTFRDYIGEETQLDTIAAEHCLAHKVGDVTERAYARSDMLEKRSSMMNVWANHVTSRVTNVPSST